MTTTSENNWEAARSSTRVDPAHPPVAEETTTPPKDLLNAIAGLDAQAVEQQMKGQALELATMLREKQQLLERREAELNARTALLERDLRIARLKQTDLKASTDPLSSPVGGEPSTCRPMRHATDDRPLPASLSPTDSNRPEPLGWRDDSANLDFRASAPAHREIDSDGFDSAIEDEEGEWQCFDAHTSELTADTIAIGEADRIALDHQYDQLETQRQELRKRELKLQRQQINTEQMHDEVTELHREALEMRLATEQVWLDIAEEFPTEDHVQRLEAIREKLADHYRMANDTLASRKDELHQRRAELCEQEQRLRQQRRDVQLWADRRYDEIESRVAKISVRERELDQQESEFHRQAMQWQKQRQEYRQQIESLSWKLHEATQSQNV